MDELNQPCAQYIRHRALRLSLTALVLLLASSLVSGCTRLFFFPMQQHVALPSNYGVDYQDVYLRAADGTRLHAWLLEPEGQPVGTIYFLHGNAENISTHFLATVWLIKQGYEVFALDYRGYGLSQGRPDLPEVFDDIEAGANWLISRAKLAHSAERRKSASSAGMIAVSSDGAKPRPLYFYGQSLGASLAITFAQRSSIVTQHFNGIVAEAAFARYDSIAKHIASKHWLTWSAQYPAKWLIRRQYDPLDAISQLALPKLIIHSQDDQIIPYRFGKALFDAAATPKEWISASGAHIRAAADESVRRSILDFMQRFADPETLPTR